MSESWAWWGGGGEGVDRIASKICLLVVFWDFDMALQICCILKWVVYLL